MDRKRITFGVEVLFVASLFLGGCDVVSARNADRVKEAASGLDGHSPAGFVVRSCRVDADCNPGIAHPDRFISSCRNEDGGTFQPGFDGPVGGSGGSCSQ